MSLRPIRRRLRPRAEGLLDAAARALHDEAALSLGGQGCRWEPLIPGDYVPYPVCTDYAREAGEIVVGGYNVMTGNLDDPATTAEAIDAVGWFRTGDVGWLDDAGNLRITDRIKDLYIAGGFNVYPAEGENVLLTHPAIAAAAVIRSRDPRWGLTARSALSQLGLIAAARLKRRYAPGLID